MLNKLLTTPSIYLIRLYQITLSPDKGLPRFWLKGKICRHEPHCSQYAIEYLKKYGFIKSIIPIMDRVSNCTPGHDIIYDPVPKGNSKFNPEASGQNSKLKSDGAIENGEANGKLKIAFFSSAPIGVPFLEALWNDERFEIIGIVTQPDQPSGRGLELKPSIIKKFALRLMEQKSIHDADYIQTPQTIKLDSKKFPGEAQEFYTWLQNLQADYFVVTAYGKLMPQYILDTPAIAPINIHWSLLPQYRGATPVQTSLLNGDNKTGMTLIIMNAGMDEGDIIGTKEVELSPSTDSEQLYEIFGSIGPDFVNDTLIQFAKGEITPAAQDHTQATFTTKIQKEDGLIDIYKDPLEEIVRKYNAYYGWPKLYFIYNDKRVIIEEIEIDDELYTKYLIARDKDSSYVLHLVDSYQHLGVPVKKLIVKPEGKKTMAREDRKNGYLSK